jgi:hypothetical protein
MANEELGLKGKGVEREVVKELDEAMSDLLGHRQKRMKHGQLEKDCAAVVVGLFKQHRLKSYNYDEKSYDLKAVEKVILHKEETEEED